MKVDEHLSLSISLWPQTYSSLPHPEAALLQGFSSQEQAHAQTSTGPPVLWADGLIGSGRGLLQLAGSQGRNSV